MSILNNIYNLIEEINISDIRKQEMSNIKQQQKQLMSPKYREQLIRDKIKVERAHQYNPLFKRQSQLYDKVADKIKIRQTYL